MTYGFNYGSCAVKAAHKDQSWKDLICGEICGQFLLAQIQKPSFLLWRTPWFATTIGRLEQKKDTGLYLEVLDHYRKCQLGS